MKDEQFWLDQAAAAFSEAAAAEFALSNARDKLGELRSLEVGEQQEREVLRAHEDEDEALRQLDGPSAPGPNRRRAKRLAQLDKIVPGRAAAIRMQTERVATAEGKMNAARSRVVAPTLNVIAGIQGASIDAIRRSFVQIAPELTKLLAADQIRLALLGARFTVPAGAPPPIGGRQVVGALTEALADCLRPPELADRMLFEAAQTLSSDIIAQIKG